MCGIVGYLGTGQATPIILESLRSLEHRGFESADICVMHSDRDEAQHFEGKLDRLARMLSREVRQGDVGIGHTHWGERGRNSGGAHTHQAGSIIVVHTGVVENYRELREKLENRGRRFRGDTDTEMIAHLVDEKLKETGNFEQSAWFALRELNGAYSVCILCEKDPRTMIAAKVGSPLVLGYGDRAYYVSSDIPAIVPHTREVVMLEDGEIAICRKGGVAFVSMTGEPLDKKPRQIQWSPLQVDKDGFRHFMLKEIYEQPRALRDTLADRLDRDRGDALLHGLNLDDRDLAGIDRIKIVTGGNAFHIAQAGKYLLEEQCGIPVEVESAAEFRFRTPVMNEKTLLLVISRYGETADCLSAVREGRAKGAKTVAVCDKGESTLALQAQGTIITHAGPETGAVSTKCFLAQMTALYLFSLRLGRANGSIDRAEGKGIVASLERIPELVQEAMRLDPVMERIACRCIRAREFLFLGRGINYPMALEGASRLKKLTCIPAEGYPAGELKHRPPGSAGADVPAVVLMPRNSNYGKVLAGISELKAQGSLVIAVTASRDNAAREEADCCVGIPLADEFITPLLMAVPLQFLAYHLAVLKGHEVDRLW